MSSKLAALALLLLVVTGCSADEATPAGAPSSASAADPLVLSAPGDEAMAGRCMTPSAEALAANATTAFAGTVASMDGDRATLEVSHWYAGGPAQRVEVAAPGQDLQALIVAVQLKPGGDYLLAATDEGRLMVCGFSAPRTDALAALYDEAFAS